MSLNNTSASPECNQIVTITTEESAEQQNALANRVMAAANVVRFEQRR
ncbi:hypothetical protein [Cellvibrio mixtus]|nr:hypothetical protein [Cellvibrio mixtus]